LLKRLKNVLITKNKKTKKTIAASKNGLVKLV